MFLSFYSLFTFIYHCLKWSKVDENAKSRQKSRFWLIWSRDRALEHLSKKVCKVLLWPQTPKIPNCFPTFFLFLCKECVQKLSPQKFRQKQKHPWSWLSISCLIFFRVLNYSREAFTETWKISTVYLMHCQAVMNAYIFVKNA